MYIFPWLTVLRYRWSHFRCQANCFKTWNLTCITLFQNKSRRVRFVVWPQGHMGLSQVGQAKPVPWTPASRAGALTLASLHRLLEGGILTAGAVSLVFNVLFFCSLSIFCNCIWCSPVFANCHLVFSSSITSAWIFCTWKLDAGTALFYDVFLEMRMISKSFWYFHVEHGHYSRAIEKMIHIEMLTNLLLCIMSYCFSTSA